MQTSFRDLKVIILGPASVGKTCFMQRYLTGEYKDNVEPSMGAALAIKKWEEQKVALWDTAGEERFASISALYCRGASAAILAYSITDEKSLQKLQDTYVPLLRDANDSCLTVVIGCKADCIKSSGRSVSEENGRKLAKEQHLKQLERARKASSPSFLDNVDGEKSFFETSALSGTNVEEVFDYIRGILLNDSKSPGSTGDTVTLTQNQQKQQKAKNSCC